MLRSTTRTSALICSECLSLHRTSSYARHQSTAGSSAFESRHQQQQEYSHAHPSYTGRHDQQQQRQRNSTNINNNNTRSGYAIHGSNQPSQNRSTNNGRSHSLMKDWKSASPSSSSRDGQSQNSINNRVTFRGGMRRDAPPSASRASDINQRSSNQRHNTSNSTTNSAANYNSNHNDNASIRNRYNFTPGSSSSSSSNTSDSNIGHRGNLRTHTSSKYDPSSPSSSSEKENSSTSSSSKPKQVNFGHGSALAAFAMKRAQQEQQQKMKEQSSNPSTSPSSSSASPSSSSQNTTMKGKEQLILRQRKSMNNRRTPKRVVEIPSTVSVNALSQILGMKLRRLQYSMERMGLTDTRADRLLPAEDASLVAEELGYQAQVVDSETGFDIYPSPPPEDPSKLSLRPPIVTIMGHVDHGKTSLLDALRSTKVVAGEAGGITQHIGAFNVPLSSLLSSTTTATTSNTNETVNTSKNATEEENSAGSITFLDTPGHAAFAAMRSRGASLTDIVVLVIAADDGIKPQTKEVIDLVKNNEDIGLVIAITKCDKTGIDISKIHNELFSYGIEVENLGGEIPCVEISSHTGKGLKELIETLNVISEIRDLRTEITEEEINLNNIISEGKIIESKIDKGKGNITTIILTRGQLKLGSLIISGKTFAKIRSIKNDKGEILEIIKPGIPVEITGWKNLPEVGDMVLQVQNEDDVKKAIETRKRKEERLKNLGDLEIINEKRRILNDAQILKKKMQENAKRNGQDPNNIDLSNSYNNDDSNDGSKLLNLIIKCDFAGTEEAVSNALAEIGNSEARVKIVETGVGDITDGDLALAKAVDGVIIGFNVKASRQILSTAQQLQITILQNNIIYRLIEQVKEKVISLLPKIYDQKVSGEASIQQVFKYSLKGSITKNIAGCRVTNGQLSKKSKVRIVRNGDTIFDGNMVSLKHHKDEVDEIRKGSDCGIMLEGFEGFMEGDTLQCYEDIERKRTL